MLSRKNQLIVNQWINSIMSLKHLCIFFSTLGVMLFQTNGWSFPRGCEVTGFGYNGTNLVINEYGEQAFYLIHNHSSQNIELQLQL